MNDYVLDTSVAVAWYLDEVFSPAARTWQERLLAGKVRLIVPALHYWEFADVLRTLVWRQELDKDLARAGSKPSGNPAIFSQTAKGWLQKGAWF